MHFSTFLTSLLLFLSFSLTHADIAQDSGPPAGYQEGYATQDNEPVGQLSICHTNCGLAGSNRGSPDMAPGVYAAAVGPNLGGAADNCGPCGADRRTEAVRTEHDWLMTDSYRVSTGPAAQSGTKEIKVMVVNHCMDCDKVDYHFDIHGSPGWDNPKIWWKPLDPSECRSGSSSSSSSTDVMKSAKNPTAGSSIMKSAKSPTGESSNINSLFNPTEGSPGTNSGSNPTDGSPGTNSASIPDANMQPPGAPGNLTARWQQSFRRWKA
ncbi:MAG: hypothetical protein LQ345_006365 [Seirophora villosa]|nr:MAG: hypothetical protein LQ345_006365 [Seirophora villosa]